MANIVQFVPTSPPDMVVDVTGAVVDSVDYKFTAPSSAYDPILFEAPNGEKLHWTPSDLVYKDEDGMFDYVVGSSPDALQASGKVARYARTFPFASDVFQAQTGKIKHWTVLDEAPRPPADYLGSGILFGVSGNINGASFLPGIYNELQSGSFILPQPTITDLAGNTVMGFYEVIDTDKGQQLFIWIDYTYIQEAVYPVMIDPTVIIGANYSFYDSSSGGRKIVTLSNWWHVIGMYDATNGMLRLYVSKDYGSTWTQLCYISISADNWGSGFALASNNNTVYVATNVGYNNGQTEFWSFDATTVSNTAQSPMALLDLWGPGTGKSSYISMTVGANGNLHIVSIHVDSSWLYKYCVYYTSTNGGVSWTGPTIIETIGASGGDLAGCCVIIPKGGNNPTILYSMYTGTLNQVRSRTWNGSAWNAYVLVISGSTGTTTHYPSAAFDNLGNLHLVFLLYNGIYNVVYYKSTDGGTTWSSQTTLTSGGTYTQKSVQIGVANNNNLYVIVHGADATSADRVKLFTFSSSWDAGVALTSSGGNTGVIAERQVSINLPYSYYDSNLSSMEADRIASDNPPTAPTGLTRTNFDATTFVSFNWAFNDPDGGDTQSAYQVQIMRVSDGAIIADTGKLNSSVTSFALGTGYCINGVNYQWKVTCWDQSGAQSPWSSLASFACYSPPTVTITSPTNGGVNATSSATVYWSFNDPYGTQTQYDIQLIDSADNPLWDSGWVMGSINTLVIPYALANNSSFKVKAQVISTTGMQSSQASNSFVTSFTYPATPIITVTSDSSHARINVSISNPIPTGGQPTISGCDIYRQMVSDATWIRIASNFNGTYSDYAVASGQTYIYKATALGDNGVNIDSLTAQSNVNIVGVWLYDVTNPIGTIINIPCNDSRAETWTVDSAMMTFAGRKGRVAEFGIGEDIKYTVNLKMTIDQLYWSRLKTLVLSKPTLCVRDYRGRKIFGVVFSLPEVDIFYGQTLTLEVDQVDYTEVV